MNYSYCTIEEAWGDNLNNEKKKKRDKKKKRSVKYIQNYPNYIEDTSYEDGIHNDYCQTQVEDNLSTKNKHRHKNSKKARKIENRYNDNYKISYDNANKEYKNYKNETKNIKKNKIPQNERIFYENELSPGMYKGAEDNEYFSNYESDYQDSNSITNEEYENFQNYDMNLIEGFESNGEQLDNHSTEENINNRVKQGNVKVKDVKSKRAGNLIDELYDKNNASDEAPSEDENNESDQESTLSTTDEEPENEIPKVENKDEPEKKISKKDIEYRLNSLNRSMNTIIKQMNNNQIFDNDSQDNVHDLILFILFGIFIIFILDSIYKLGKYSSSTTY